MRDPKRINRIINKIRRLWKKDPDSRLCQLISNITESIMGIDKYYLEDDILERLLTKEIDKECQTKD